MQVIPLPNYKREIHLQRTIFGGIRFCLTGANTTDFYDLNWCMGERSNELFVPCLQAVTVALEANIKLPACSEIKPLFKDKAFLDYVEQQTGVKLCEHEPI